MGAFTDGDSPEKIIKRDEEDSIKQTEEGGEGFETDVDGVKANALKDGIPVFDVDTRDFYQNMNFGRKRIRFANGSPAGEYMRKTRYSNPFYIRTNDNGKVYFRKVK